MRINNEPARQTTKPITGNQEVMPAKKLSTSAASTCMSTEGMKGGIGQGSLQDLLPGCKKLADNFLNVAMLAVDGIV